MRKVWLVLSLLSLVPAVALATLFGLSSDDLNVTSYRITSNKIKSSLKIVQLSDLHNHSIEYSNGSLIDKVDAENPDYVLCTGDLIDNHTTSKDFANLDLIFSHFKEKGYPVYYVSGNHEAVAPKDIADSLTDLLDKNDAINAEATSTDGSSFELGSSGVSLFGLRDPCYVSRDGIFLTKNYGDIPNQLLKSQPKASSFNLLLSHRPELFSLYAEKGFDLCLSGHTHGNQVGFTNNTVTVNQIFTPSPHYIAGPYFLSHSELIVSRGLGYSYSTPYRVGCNAEIVSISLEKA